MSKREKLLKPVPSLFLTNSRKSWSIPLSNSTIQASAMGRMWDTVPLRGRGAMGGDRGCCLLPPYRELLGEDTQPQIRAALGHIVKQVLYCGQGNIVDKGNLYG